MRQLTDFIQVVPDVLSEEDRKRVLEILKASTYWEPSIIGRDGGSIDLTVRNCDTIPISKIVANRMVANDADLASLDQILFQAVGKAMSAYNKDYEQIYISMDTGYEALRYKEGGFYIEHVDAHTNNPRTVSCSFSLNDDYGGGEFAFFNKEHKVRAPAGSAVLFPSNFCFPHQILPVTEGTRYSIVTWFQ